MDLQDCHAREVRANIISELASDVLVAAGARTSFAAAGPTPLFARNLSDHFRIHSARQAARMVAASFLIPRAQS